jgi:hypothetical protein
MWRLAKHTIGGIDFVLDKCTEISSIKEQEEIAGLLYNFVA